jgi:hypothetical protein
VNASRCRPSQQIVGAGPTDPTALPHAHLPFTLVDCASLAVALSGPLRRGRQDLKCTRRHVRWDWVVLCRDSHVPVQCRPRFRPVESKELTDRAICGFNCSKAFQTRSATKFCSLLRGDKPHKILIPPIRWTPCLERIPRCYRKTPLLQKQAGIGSCQLRHCGIQIPEIRLVLDRQSQSCAALRAKLVHNDQFATAVLNAVDHVL